MNKKELRARMARYGDTYTSLAIALGISYAGFYNKINGKTTFTQREIQVIKERYNLSAEDIDNIFFAFEVA